MAPFRLPALGIARRVDRGVHQALSQTMAHGAEGPPERQSVTKPRNHFATTGEPRGIPDVQTIKERGTLAQCQPANLALEVGRTGKAKPPGVRLYGK